MRKSGDQADYPKTIKNGSVVVKIYRIKHPSTASGFVFAVSYVTPRGRKMQQFAAEEDALEEARLKAAQLSEGRTDAVELTRADHEELMAARELCGSVPLRMALQEWRHAHELTNGQILPAAKAWAAKTTADFTRIDVAKAIDAFIAAKDKAGKQGERTYRSKLNPLKTVFKERYLDSITVSEFTAYLERYDDAVTRNDFRKRTVALCRWAQKHAYLPRGAALEIEATERAAEKKTKIGILTPTVFGQLLRFFREEHREYLAPLVLAGFCGIRADEIHGKRDDNREERQVWEDIHLKRKFAQVTNAKTNTASWRIVPLCPAAIEWLELCPEQKGPVCEPAAMERVRALAIEAGFELPENCFRHSFISYRIAVTGDKPKVATEAGNSVGEIDHRYRVPIPEDQGKAWFAMTPAKAAKLPAIPRPSPAEAPRQTPPGLPAS